MTQYESGIVSAAERLESFAERVDLCLQFSKAEVFWHKKAPNVESDIPIPRTSKQTIHAIAARWLQ